MEEKKGQPENKRLEVISFALGLLLPLMFGLSLFQTKFLNNIGMLYLLQDIQCGTVPVGLAAVITGWVSLVRSRGIHNPRSWMAITGITLGGFALLWMLLGIFHSVLGIGPSE